MLCGELCLARRLPFVGVRRLEAHVLTARQARACPDAMLYLYYIFMLWGIIILRGSAKFLVLYDYALRDYYT